MNIHTLIHDPFLSHSLQILSYLTGKRNNPPPRNWYAPLATSTAVQFLPIVFLIQYFPELMLSIKGTPLPNPVSCRRAVAPIKPCPPEIKIDISSSVNPNRFKKGWRPARLVMLPLGPAGCCVFDKQDDLPNLQLMFTQESAFSKLTLPASEMTSPIVNNGLG